MLKFSDREEMIRSLIQPGSRVAELGVMNGHLSHVLLETAPTKLYLVDNWQYEMVGFFYGRATTFYPESSVLNVFQQFSAQIKTRQVEIHIRNTLDFLDNVPPLDYLYIDDCHDYEHLKKELTKCPPSVILVHDYCEVFPGVIRAVDESGFEKIAITDEPRNPVFPRADWMPEQVAYNTIALRKT